MTLIDKQFMDTPFYGVGQMTWNLKPLDHKVNKKRIRRLMRLMRFMPIYQKPNASKPSKVDKVHPYFLGGVKITQANHVWCADITYIPMRKGFRSPPSNRWRARSPRGDCGLGHVARVSWRLSNTMDAEFYAEALNEAILRYGPPKIFNTDQGSQFTSFKWTDTLPKPGSKFPWTGKADSWTISSSNGSGARSNMSVFIYMLGAAAEKPKRASTHG